MSDPTAFKQEVRSWLEENCPQSIRVENRSLSDTVWGGRNPEFPSEDAKIWFERMRDKGWITPDWPTELGGGGLSAAENKILKKEMARLNCPAPLFDLSLFLFGPVILEYGNEAQKKEHIPKISRGEIRWCQGYSEPGAGSDLASLKTKAEDKGDHFLVNGSKIWTTNADKSDWIFCLVRTDFNAPKHNGISVLLIDMESEGISTAPIRLISGESEFCQTFFDNVKVPKENLLGEQNGGWAITKRSLQHERKLMSSEGFMGGDGPNIVDIARKYVDCDKEGKLLDANLRSKIARHLMNNQADMLKGMRIFFGAKAGVADNNLPLTMKYSSTSELQRRDELMLEILGNRGLSWSDDEFTEEEKTVTQSWAKAKAYTIAGGSSEVQLNIIAKRVLGLPEK